jgi:hypothetical protein
MTITPRSSRRRDIVELIISRLTAQPLYYREDVSGREPFRRMRVCLVAVPIQYATM